MHDYRKKLFDKERKVICTGNPNRPFTIASEVKKFFPNATFIHRQNGFDLANVDDDTVNNLSNIFKSHNTFINASYIGPFVQSRLLNVCFESTKICDVFNIGSTHEYDMLGTPIYKDSKLDLREKSLKLNSYRFKTCHIIVGSIKKSEEKEKEHYIDSKEICNIIQFVMNQRFNVPIISLDQPKEPW